MIDSLWQDETGLTTVEYAIMLAVMVVAGIIAWQSLGEQISNSVDDSTASWPGGEDSGSVDANGG